MGRPKRLRKARYKRYYERDAENEEVPESTSRYQTGGPPQRNYQEIPTGEVDVSNANSCSSLDSSSEISDNEADVSDTSSSSSLSDLNHEPQRQDLASDESNGGSLPDSASLSAISSTDADISSSGEEGNLTSEAAFEYPSSIQQSQQQYLASTVSDGASLPDSASLSAISSSDADTSNSGEEGNVSNEAASEESTSSIQVLDGSSGELEASSELHHDDRELSSLTSHTLSSDSEEEDRRHHRESFHGSSSPASSDSPSLTEQQERNNSMSSEEECDGIRAQKMDTFAELKCILDKKINVNVSISLGEILNNLLILDKNHSLSHLEKENIMKFANSIFNSGNVLPSSRYLLDKLFYSKRDMVYHFYCSECTEFLGSVPAENPSLSQILCPNPSCKKMNILSDLSTASYFVTFDIPSQIELLLGDACIREKLLNPVDVADTSEPSIMKDIYNGKVYRRYAQAVKNDPRNAAAQVISFVLSVDSASLCSFSKQSVCPCFLMILELPQMLRMKHLLLAGLCFGRVKEKLDLFLPPIVEHIIDLSTSGFSIDVGLEQPLFLKAFLIGCCADSVARCDVQGVHAHRGDYPCSWCLIEGEEYGAARIFRFDAPLVPRTLVGLMRDAKEALRTKTVVNGVKYICPLAPAPLFHSIEGFLVDQMHAKDEGNTKSFLKAWLGEDGKTDYYIGSPSKKKIMNKRLKQVRPPKEFRKAVKDFKDFHHWTGRELENFGLFLSVPVLMNILPERFLKHWAFYVQGMYILLLSEIPFGAIDISENLLEDFCENTETLYGAHMMRFNLHLLRHFGENCRQWGNIYAVSAYAFEYGNQEAKKLVHDCNFIPNQVCRGFSESRASVLLKRLCETTNTTSFEESINRQPKSANVAGKVKLKGPVRRYRPTEEEQWFINYWQLDASHIVGYDQIEKDGCNYESCFQAQQGKRDNSWAQLKDRSIILIRKILHDTQSDDIWIVGSRVRCEPSPYVPESVLRFNADLSFQFVVTNIDEDVEFHKVENLHTICVSLQLDHGHFISPMPNIMNMF